jgi:hypothetical protein
LHLAVAPVGSVLLAVAAGADFEAVDDLAAAGAVVVVAAGAAVAAADGAAGAEAVVAAAAGLFWLAFWTPPWPLQAPFPVAEEVVPSLQVVGLLDDAGAAGAAVAGAGGAAGAAAGAVVEAAFWTPPCPLQAPFPVAEEVVPSLQVVAAVASAAKAGSDNANAIKGAAMSPTRFRFFMKVHSLV